MSRSILPKILYFAGGVLLVWLTIRYFFPIALPFLLGLWLATAAEPGIRLMDKKLHFPRWLASALSVTGICLLTVIFLTLLLGLLMRQLARLQDVLPQLEAVITTGWNTIRGWLGFLTAKLPDGMRTALQRLLDNAFSGGGVWTQPILEKLPEMATGLLGHVSSGLFGLLTGIISGYMISRRLPEIRQKINARLPESWQSRYRPVLREMRRALGGWILAELKLAGVAFVLLLVGFWILGIPNATVLAGLITIVDAFPVLGVGTVLIPWSLVCLLQENIARGLGILGLYVVIWLIRSILEPRLVGKGLGLDPLLTLVSIYAGWKLLGIVGMLLAPILAMMAQQSIKALKH